MQSIVKQQLLEGIKTEKVQTIKKKVQLPAVHAKSIPNLNDHLSIFSR